MGLKVVIVGGVAGGASAAARLRRLNEEAEIILFEKGSYISYANCGLPYYIGEVIKDKEKLEVQRPEDMSRRFKIDVRTNSEVKKIIPGKKLVEVYDSVNDRTYTESYDKLLLSPGAEPVRPRIGGTDSDKVFTLRNIPDTFRIKEFVDNKKPGRAIIVGAGFIGLEVAENLHRRGIKVTVVELADHVIGPLDFEMAAIVHQHLRDKGIELCLKDGVETINDTDDGVEAVLASGKRIKAGMVVLGIGVRPETKLASEAGLKLGDTGGILVDEHMRTSDPDIYAVGDAVEVRDYISGKPALIPLAGPANKQGRIAANNICGIEEAYEGTQGTSIVKIFDLTVALTGNNERILARNGVDFEKSFTHSSSHAGYYPGAIPMSIKLLFSRSDGKLLGAQVVGYDGVDKRLDVLATAIRAGMTVYDLEKLELAYAPPFSSAKDPVNMAGYTAANILKGYCNIFHWNEVAGLDRSRSFLLDVRTAMEYELGTIEGAVNIPLDELRDRLGEIPGDKDIYVICQVGLRGYIACRILMQSGFGSVKNLSGGYKTYHAAIQELSGAEAHEKSAIESNFAEKSSSGGNISLGGSISSGVNISSAGKASSEDEKITAGEGGQAMQEASASAVEAVELDACGLQCPGPIMKVYEAMKGMREGELLSVKATDPAFAQDIKAWCDRTGNILLGVDYDNKTFTASVRKGVAAGVPTAAAGGNDKTMVIFSNDLDRAIASFIIANGAAAMGRKVTMFFTFWGLNILRKTEKINVRKDLISRMFGFMMPRGSRKLALSKMNMGGMGARMIRGIMKKKNVSSLEELIRQAQANGINMVACNMSMDIMGIKKEELIDGVEIGGVAAFLGAAEQSDMSLFI